MTRTYPDTNEERDMQGKEPLETAGSGGTGTDGHTLGVKLTIENCNLHIGQATHLVSEGGLLPGVDLIDVIGGVVHCRRDPLDEHQWIVVRIDGATVLPSEVQP